MRTAKGMTYVYIAASLAFTLIPPPVARMLAALLLITGVAMVWWTQQQDIVLVGLVEDIASEGSGPAFAAVQPPTLDEPVPLLIPAGSISEGGVPKAGDLIMAFGAVSPDVAGAVAVDWLFAAETAYVLPTSLAFEAYAQLNLQQTIAETNDLGIALMAVLIVLFAVVVLRVGIAVAFAPIAMLSAWLVLTWNAELWAMVPIPEAMITSLSWCAAAIGAVVAYKSTLRDPSGLGLRVAGAILAIPVVYAMDAMGLVSTPLRWVLVPVALIWPVLAPTLGAALLMREGLSLDLPMTAAVAVGLLLLRWPVLQRMGRAVGAAPQPASTVTPAPDRTGAIDLDGLLRQRKEA